MPGSSWPTPDTDPEDQVDDVQYEKITTSWSADGLIGGPGGTPVVYADGSGRHVKIAALKRALLRGRQFDSGSSVEIVPLAANASGNSRLDLIVLRLDRDTWNVTIEVKEGIPASTPALPALEQDGDDEGSGTGVWEFPLAQVLVTSGVTNILSTAVKELGWYVGQPIIKCTADSRPAIAPGLVLSEGSDYLVAVGSQWVRLTTVNDVMTLTAGWAGTNGTPVYNAQTTKLTIATINVPLIPDHFYEFKLSAMVFGAVSGTNFQTMRLGIWDGTTNLVFDERQLVNGVQWIRFEMTAPFRATSAGTKTIYATAERRTGTVIVPATIYARRDVPVLLRAMDLGNRVTVGGT